jgi:hypothetical protein
MIGPRHPRGPRPARKRPGVGPGGRTTASISKFLVRNAVQFTLQCKARIVVSRWVYGMETTELLHRPSEQPRVMRLMHSIRDDAPSHTRAMHKLGIERTQT